MAKRKKSNFLSNEEKTVWLKHIQGKELTEEEQETANQLEEVSVNLLDTTTLINLLLESVIPSMQSSIVEVYLLRHILINELKLTQKDYDKYKESFEKEIGQNLDEHEKFEEKRKNGELEEDFQIPEANPKEDE